MGEAPDEEIGIGTKPGGGGTRRALARPPGDRSAAVELDDQLLLDGQLDVLATRQLEHLAGERLAVELEPLGDATAASALHRGADEVVLARAFLDADRLALAHH